MFRRHAFAYASTLVLCAAFCVTPSMTKAQTTLPPVTIEAPRAVRASPAAQQSPIRPPPPRRKTRGPAVSVATAPAQTRNVTAGAARENLNQAPSGQTQTTIDRTQFDNRPAFSVG